MAKKEKFVLVSLKEDKAKELAQVISNDTCRKILEYLSEKDASESEIAKNLDLPISTVHYNIQLLVKSGLVKAEEFVYSEKGKEVNLYSLSKKLIIIAPEKSNDLKNSIKNLLPVAIAGFLISSLMYLFKDRLFGAMETESMLKSTVPAAAESMVETSVTVTSVPNYALWFLYGIVFTIALYIIISFLRRDK